MSVSHACASEAEAIGVSSNEAKIAAGGEPRSASIVFAISLKDETGQRDFMQRRATLLLACLVLAMACTAGCNLHFSWERLAPAYSSA